MPTIRLTSKYQATFPRTVCQNMGLKPGDSLMLEDRILEGERVWVLRKSQASGPQWFGCLAKYAKGKPHRMDAVRKSIEEGRGNDTVRSL